MDETTTQVVEDAPDTAVDNTQAVEQNDEQAVNTNDEQTTDTSTDEPDTSDTSNDEDMTDWASKKGIDLSTPEGQQKALKSMRESEKAFHAKSQEASDLGRQLSTSTAVDADASDAQKALSLANELNNQQIVSRWIDQSKVSPEEVQAMRDYGDKDPNTLELVNTGLLTLDQYRAIANSAKPVDEAAIRKQGGQEALETLANKQRATAVKGSASSNQSSSTLTKENVEQWYSGLGTEGRKNPTNQAKLEQILAS